MATIPPEYLSQVEDLIERLYEPPGPDRQHVDRIQRLLQELQRSPAGWDLADKLSSATSMKARFFGALTFTVKLKLEGHAMSSEELQSLHQKLISWLWRAFDQDDARIVTDKICSTLVTLFLIPQMPWTRCIRQVATYLFLGRLVPEDVDDGLPSIGKIMESLSSQNPKKMRFVLSFTSTLATEGTKINAQHQRLIAVHERINANIPEAMEIVSVCFLLPIALFDHSIEGPLQCLEPWLDYIRNEFSGSELVALMQLSQPLVSTAATLLSNNMTFYSSSQFFISLFESEDDHKALFKDDDFGTFVSLLTTLSMNGEYLEGLESYSEEVPEDEAVSFAELVLACAEAAESRSVQYETDRYHALIELVHRITKSQRYDNINQRISGAIVGFWDAFCTNRAEVEFEKRVLDANFEDVNARSHWKRAIEELCEASRMPLTVEQEFEDRRTGENVYIFSLFRNTVADLARESWETWGLPIFLWLVNIAKEAYDRYNAGIENNVPDWALIESCMHYMLEFADTGSHSHEDDTINFDNLFESRLFQDAMNPAIYFPQKIRQSAIVHIGDQSHYFGRVRERLLNALETLNLFSGIESTMEVSSKSILKLCESPKNRQALSDRLSEMLSYTARVFVDEHASDTTKNNILSATSCIVQAQSQEDQKADAIERLLHMIETQYRLDCEKSERNLNKEQFSDVVRPPVAALTRMNCVASSMQAPESDTVDLDPVPQDLQLSYWQGMGRGLHHRIVEFLRVLVNDGALDELVLEAACQVVKSGYRQKQPGPFSFEPQVTTDLITSVPLNNSRLDIVWVMATAFVSSNSSNPSAIEAVLPPLVFHLHKTSGYRNLDPDVSYAMLDFLSSLMPRWLPQFWKLNGSSFQEVMNFTLRALAAADPLPKRAAAKFWSLIIDATPSDMQSSEHYELFLKPVVFSFGPALMLAVINQIGGDADRSALTHSIGILRKLVFHYGREAKAWMTLALADSTFPSSRVDKSEKSRFQAQVFNLRGDRKTEKIASAFWSSCRGLGGL